MKMERRAARREDGPLIRRRGPLVGGDRLASCQPTPNKTLVVSQYRREEGGREVNPAKPTSP